MLSPVVIDTMVWNRETREASGKERRRGGGTPRESTLSLSKIAHTPAVSGQKPFIKPINKDSIWCILHCVHEGLP